MTGHGSRGCFESSECGPGALLELIREFRGAIRLPWTEHLRAEAAWGDL